MNLLWRTSGGMSSSQNADLVAVLFQMLQQKRKRTVKTRCLDNHNLQFIISRLSSFKCLKEKYLNLVSIVNTEILQAFFK